MKKPLSKVTAFLLIMVAGICTSITNGHSETLNVTASHYLGKGEVGGDNQGEFVRMVLDSDKPFPWCSAFVSYCLEENGHYGYMPYILRAKEYLKYGKPVSKPKPGDIVILSRQGGGHVAIVDAVDQKGITVIEGNYGKFPAKVKRNLILKSSKRSKEILGFRRLKVS